MIWSSKQKESKYKKKQLKIEDFRHAGNENKQIKVDKINPFHIYMLLGQIIEIDETGYVRIILTYPVSSISIIIVTEYGKVNTLITPSQLYPCTASNMKLDFPYTNYIENVLIWKNKTNCYN